MLGKLILNSFLLNAFLLPLFNTVRFNTIFQSSIGRMFHYASVLAILGPSFVSSNEQCSGTHRPYEVHLLTQDKAPIGV